MKSALRVLFLCTAVLWLYLFFFVPVDFTHWNNLNEEGKWEMQSGTKKSVWLWDYSPHARSPYGTSSNFQDREEIIYATWIPTLLLATAALAATGYFAFLRETR
jgi:hypothetical protein